MLCSLNLTNFVLAKSVEIEFTNGFGVLTGETGAGKSLLFDALQCVTGRRAETSLIRENEDRADISAMFELNSESENYGEINTKLDQWAIDVNDELILRRVIDINGRSKSFINGAQVTLTQLDEIGSILLDIHGQHDSLLLMQPAKQRDLLDEFAKETELAKKVAQKYKEWQTMEIELNNANNNLARLEEQKEQLKIRTNDLKNIKNAHQWEEINSQHNRLAHLQSLQENGGKILGLLEEDENNIESSLQSAIKSIEIMKKYDSGISDIFELLRSAQTESREASRALRFYLEKLEVDQQTLVEIEEIVGRQMEMSRKYQTKPENLDELRKTSEDELTKLTENLDITEFIKKVTTAKNEYFDLAQKLSKKRASAAINLTNKINQRLPPLGMAEAEFLVKISQADASNGGLENIEFLVRGLAGNIYRPLVKVASGGELSRISLAIFLSVRSSNNKVYLFDEIDAGIGGAVAEAVGKMLAELAKQNPLSQILAVTHLPQVACCANWQAVVEKTFSKQSQNSIAESIVNVLSDNESRIKEIARMLGGENITEATLRHAKEMLKFDLI